MSTIFCHFELINFHCKNWRKKPKLTTHGGKKEDTIFILTYSAQWRVGKVKKTVTNKQSNCCPQHKTPLKTKTMCYQATWPNQYQFVHSATSRPQQTKLGKIEKNSLFSLPSLSPSSFANWTHIPFDHSTILWI